MGSPDCNVRRHARGALESLLVLVMLAAVVVLPCSPLTADPVAVRYAEGLQHGFLIVRSMDGKKLADGELTQVAHGSRVISHLVFRFYDGSIYDEKTEFSQEGTFRLISDHVVQKRPSFKHATDTLIDVAKGEVTVRAKDGHNQEKVSTEKAEMPPDISNGLLFTIAKNLNPTASQTTVSLLATTPKPRIVKLVFTPAGEKTVSSGRTRDKATVYKLKVDVGGLAGALAKITGKQPANTHVWVLQGEAPAFIQSEGPFYGEGPEWRVQLTSPRAAI